MHYTKSSDDKLLTNIPKTIKYIWWYNTYPLEFAEFLLVTALTRGVWLHPLCSSMPFYSNFILIFSSIKYFIRIDLIFYDDSSAKFFGV